jgi:hypothetical protein
MRVASLALAIGVPDADRPRRVPACAAGARATGTSPAKPAWATTDGMGEAFVGGRVLFMVNVV